jgi:hypothetical protein
LDHAPSLSRLSYAPMIPRFEPNSWTGSAIQQNLVGTAGIEPKLQTERKAVVGYPPVAGTLHRRSAFELRPNLEYGVTGENPSLANLVEE